MITELNSEKLTPEEFQRLDSLLSSARSFHYLSIILAGLSLAVSSLDQASDIILPFGSIALPQIQASVGLYILVITLVMATDRMFLTARPWLRLDPRRPQFAWFPLAANPIGSASVTFWLIIPVLVCAIASASTVQVKGDTTGIALSFAGVVTVLVPRSIYGYLELIQSRTDHRGGRATYSMVLLYWYRVLRQILYTAFFIIPVLAVVPKWRLTMLNWSGVLIAAILVGLGFRFVGGLSFIYRRIDQIGVRYGFPAKSEHY